MVPPTAVWVLLENVDLISNEVQPDPLHRLSSQTASFFDLSVHLRVTFARVPDFLTRGVCMTGATGTPVGVGLFDDVLEDVLVAFVEVEEVLVVKEVLVEVEMIRVEDDTKEEVEVRLVTVSLNFA